MSQLRSYDRTQSYDWNYTHAPSPPAEVQEVEHSRNRTTFCGLPVNSPLGIAAGPLLNGAWLLYYAALGFDVLTYKTVRSRSRPCYALPNLQPIREHTVVAGIPVVASESMQGSWAISFGMPSRPVDVWRADIEWARGRLASGKLLSVSVVASPEPQWNEQLLAEDYARCADWAIQSGADIIELNFSCPNVSSCDGQLYQQPRAAGEVAACVRAAIGTVPLIAKIGHVTDAALARQLLQAVVPAVDGLSMTNCISAEVVRDRRPLFDGERRGIGGEAIRQQSIDQIQLFARLIAEQSWPTRLIGVGGISDARHVNQYLEAGAEAVQLATSAMLDPTVGLRIRQQLGW